MLEVLIDNKNGNAWAISVSSLTWKTGRIGKIGTLELTIIQSSTDEKGFKINGGDLVRVKDGNFGIFYGYVFKISDGKDEQIKITAYDQTRYLQSDETYVFVNKTATEIIKRIANDFTLKIGKLVDTGYKIPTMSEDEKKALDTACKALDATLIATGKNYILYDDFGQLVLKDIEDMKISDTAEFYIGDGSLLYDYSFERTIDNETYNKIKLVRDNKKTKKRDVFIVQDSKNITKWGLLQNYRKMDENMNDAQIKDIANKMIQLYNREKKTMKLECIGNWKVRAGSFIRIIIQKFNINTYFMVEECTHKFEGNDHTMSLDLKVIS